MGKRRLAVAWIAAAFLGILLALSIVPTTVAYAADDAQTELERLQDEIEQTAKDYDKALEEVEELQERIDENQAKVDELEAILPEQRAQASAAISTHYKMQQDTPGLVTLLLSSESFNEFISTFTYLDIVSSRSVSEVEALIEIENELLEARTELDADKAVADDKLQDCEDALEKAKAARKAAQDAATARAQAEAGAAAAALAQAQAAQAAGGELTSNSGLSNPIPIPAQVATGAPTSIDWETDKEAFIEHWGPRIDAYLGNAPLGGHGTTFAEAAWEYGIDPRFSPAISCIESTKGTYCFLPHNAWGWGSSSWPDWDTAIWAHVAGLATGYGYTLTPSGAEKYCPGTGGVYYAAVLAQINSI